MKWGALCSGRRRLALPVIFAAAVWAPSACAEDIRSAEPGPVFSDSGPDADLYGAADGYPVGTRGGAPQLDKLVGVYSHFGDFAGTYTEIVEHKRIEYAFGDRKAEVEFVPGPNGIVVRVVLDSEATHSVEQQQGGWQAILDNFARYVEVLACREPEARSQRAVTR